jgi:hypothetical protein
MQMQPQPHRFKPVRRRFAADHGPAPVIEHRLGQQAQWQAALHRQPQERGMRVPFGRQIAQPGDQPPRHAHRPGIGVVDIDPFKSGGHPRLCRQRQHARRFAQLRQRDRGLRQQAIGQHDHFVICGDQGQQRVRRGDHMKAGTACLARLLQRDHFAGQRFGHQHHARAPERQRQAKLVARDRTATDRQIAAQALRSIGDRLGNGQQSDPQGPRSPVCAPPGRGKNAAGAAWPEALGAGSPIAKPRWR